MQLPIILKYATTNYKCQGETLDSAIVDLNPAPGQRLDSSFAYVPLSRIKTFSSLTILRDFPIRVLTQGIRLDLKNDLNRLEDLADETENKFSLKNS
jgi:ATP-dependent exoDNAse (exonuclease V) alpha subunit